MQTDPSWFTQRDITPYMRKNNDTLAYPCGNIAKYFFNDTFISIKQVDHDKNVTVIDDSNIAFPADVLHKFKTNMDIKKTGQYYRDVENEHFMVWY